MKRERRQPTKAELAKLTSRRPVVRRFKPDSPSRRTSGDLDERQALAGAGTGPHGWQW